MFVCILKITLHRIVLEQKKRNADFGRSGLYMGASFPVAHREYPSSDLRAPLHGHPNLYNLWHHRAGSLWVLPPLMPSPFFCLKPVGLQCLTVRLRSFKVVCVTIGSTFRCHRGDFQDG